MFLENPHGKSVFRKRIEKKKHENSPRFKEISQKLFNGVENIET